MNHDIEYELRPYLFAGEKLLWKGQPKTGIAFRNSDFFMIPFTFLWAGFAFFWEANAIKESNDLFFTLFGVPFVLVGLRFFLDARKRENTFYGITENRIIIKSGIFKSQIKSLNIKTLPEISFSQKADFSGTIKLGQGDIRTTAMQGFDWPGVAQIPSLEFINDVKSVYNKIIELQMNNGN